LRGDGTFATPAGGGSVATDAIWDAKGDLAVGTGANTAVKLTVGSDAAQIYADSSTSTGLRWGPSIISPSQITSDQDNYAPTGWAKCQIARISGDNGIRAITSLAATFNGDEKRIINIGSFPIYFPSEHPDGTAGNRFTGLASDFILYPGADCIVIYDGTSSRWRVMGQPKAVIDGHNVYYSVSGGSISTGDYGDVTFSSINSGTINAVSSTATIPAAFSLSTSTPTNGGEVAYFVKSGVTYSYFGSAGLTSKALVSLPDLSDATNTYTASYQISNGPNNATLIPNNSVGIRYTHGTNSGKWEGYSKDNAGSETAVDLGITVAAATLYNLAIDFDKSRSEARFYIDGVFAGRVTANIPNAVICGTRAIVLKSAGSTARTFNIHSMSAQAVYP